MCLPVRLHILSKVLHISTEEDDGIPVLCAHTGTAVDDIVDAAIVSGDAAQAQWARRQCACQGQAQHRMQDTTHSS